jgi:hypothetical protein
MVLSDVMSGMCCVASTLFAVIGSAALVSAEVEGPLLPPPADHSAGAPAHNLLDESAEATPGPAGGWTSFLRELSHEIIPDEYEVRENWGHKTEVFSGFNVREGDLLPRISKRTKRVNHGVWRRFKVRLIHPDELRFEVRNARLEPAGGFACEVLVSARLRCTAHAEFWNLGVRTGSATVQSDVTLKAAADFQVVGRQADPDDDSFFTEMVYSPEVARVKLRLTDLDVRRIGKVDGDAAEALGDASRKVVQHFIEEQEPRVRKRLREEIDAADAEWHIPMPRALLSPDAGLPLPPAGGP